MTQAKQVVEPLGVGMLARARTPRDQAEALLARWRADPCAFSADVLANPDGSPLIPWDGQARMIRAIGSSMRSATRSGHKCGKSTGFAIAALWHWCCFPGSRVFLTAPTGRQVRMVLWREVKRLHATARVPLGGTCADAPDTGLRAHDGREVVGFATDEAENIAGFSGPNMLWLLDEASGLHRKITDAILGNRAGGARVALGGNPTRLDGEFFDAFHQKAALYTRVHMSSVDAARSNLSGTGMATSDWVAECAREWGTDSPLYQVRVAGNFPTTGADMAIPVFLIDAGVQRGVDYDVRRGTRRTRLHLGVDVARYGDDETVVVLRRGRWTSAPIPVEQGDTFQTAQAIARIAATNRRVEDPADPLIKIDANGVGAGVYDALAAMPGLVVVPVIGSEAADDPAKFANMRTQLHFGVREFLADGEGILSNDPKQHAELAAARYKLDARGRLQLVSKDDVRARLGRSPDRGDATCLAVYEGPGSADEAEGGLTIGRRRRD